MGARGEVNPGAYIHLIWLALMGPPLWGATAVSLVVAASIFRWV